MVWDGNTVYTIWGYTPKTTPAIKWTQVSNGNWRAVDRGIAQDSFESDVTFIGPRSELEDLETTLDSNRETFSATFSGGEEIFGMDLDYSSSYTVTVVDYGTITQQDYDKWTMNLTLKLFTPVFLSTTGSLSTLRMSSFVSVQESEFDIVKQFTYTQTGVYTDRGTDPGVFEADFTQTPDEMKAIRRYLLNTNRTGSFTFPSFPSATTPFGFREGTGSFNTRIVNWTERGRSNYQDWGISLKFVREF